jgi:hypothetical protein
MSGDVGLCDKSGGRLALRSADVGYASRSRPDSLQMPVAVIALAFPKGVDLVHHGFSRGVPVVCHPINVWTQFPIPFGAWISVRMNAASTPC